MPLDISRFFIIDDKTYSSNGVIVYWFIAVH